jgi:GNAT superfamily N-acetyltransferase
VGSNWTLEYSSLDSIRFNLRVCRGRGTQFDPRQFVSEAVALDCDVAVIRLPAGSGTTAKDIAASGFPVVHADTLVYYECVVESREPRKRRSSNATIRYATLEDVEELSSVVYQVFRDYESHYSANQLFDHSVVPAGYAEWAASFVGQLTKHVFVACVGDQIVGFLTSEVADDTVEIVLNGVHPDWSHQGIYGDLIKAVQEYAVHHGLARVIVSTQVQNFPVQRAWRREGFRLYSAYDTYHINTQLHTGAAAAERTIRLHGESPNRSLFDAVRAILIPNRDGGMLTSGITILPLKELAAGDHLVSIRSVRSAGNADQTLLIGKILQDDGSVAAILRVEGGFSISKEQIHP